MTAVDYSDARPTGATLAAHGITAVGRYLAPPGDSRALEKPEYDDLKAHSIDVWLVREGATQGMLAGANQATQDVQIVHDNLTRLGLPLDTFVYTSADFDVPPSSSNLGLLDAYQRTFIEGHGAANTGVYGGMVIINRFRSSGLAARFWKSAASSWDHGQTGAIHIEQMVSGAPLDGTDADILHADEYGQVGATPTPATRATPEEEDDMSQNNVQYIYTRSKDKTDVKILVNVESGFFFEFIDNSTGSIAVGQSKALQCGSIIRIGEGGRNSIKAQCDAIKAVK